MNGKRNIIPATIQKKIEYGSYFGDSEQKMFDYMFIEATNERLNGCIVDQNYYYPSPPRNDLNQ